MIPLVRLCCAPGTQWLVQILPVTGPRQHALVFAPASNASGKKASVTLPWLASMHCKGLGAAARHGAAASGRGRRCAEF